MIGAGRVAIVTGAARGIGAATVRELANNGWSVLAIDIAADITEVPYPMGTPDQLAAVAEPENVEAFVADVRDPAALAAAVVDAEALGGGLDAAIAVAGVMVGGHPQWELPIEQERTLLDINLSGVLNLARAAVPALLRRPRPRSGRFLAVASASATRGMPSIAAYCASKAAVGGAIRALAAELGPRGVTANAVSPGSTDTDILAATGRVYGIAAEAFAAQQPLNRLLEPAEVARALAWLAGPDTGAITGAVLAVDGGLAL